jgi:steroid delta-isomerase-like uncharacterized protein
MSDRKDLVQRFYKEVFENGNVDAIDELVTENAVEHQDAPPGFQRKPGREGIKDECRLYIEAFRPMSVEVHEQYEDGDTVITRATFTGTHSGQFGPLPATGKTATVAAIDITRYEGDKAAEHWGMIDSVGLLTQLGVLPPM